MVVVSGGGGNPWAKEMTIRRKMASIFNKTQEHFPSLREYNDYLEEVEDMTFNLIEGIDVEAIEAKIVRYEKENAEQIYLSRAKRAEDLAAALQASRMNPGKTEANDTAAGSSQGISGGAGGQGQYAPAAVPGGLAQPRPTGMPSQPIGNALDPLQGDGEETRRLRAERAARAGGWTAELGRRRALEETFSAIFI
jgi:CDK-activating kinase assembly factor MAT1